MNTGGKWPVNSRTRSVVPAAGPVSEGAVVGPLVAHSTKGGRRLRQGRAGEWTTYFVVADAAPLGVSDATDFARELPRRFGVAAIPVQVIHDDPAAAPTLLRFAFCKRDEVLRGGASRLARLGA